MRFPTFLAILGAALIPSISIAVMQPMDMRNTLNGLARMSFDIKDLVLSIKESKNPGALQDVFDEMDDLFDGILTNIQLAVGSATITGTPDQQSVYEAYSYFVQALFEFMDSLGVAAPVFTALDKQNEFRIPAAVREISGVTDAFLFQLIAVFPSNGSYALQAANQKAQVDTHFRRAVHSFHLVTAQSINPYGNITTTASTLPKSETTIAARRRRMS